MDLSTPISDTKRPNVLVEAVSPGRLQSNVLRQGMNSRYEYILRCNFDCLECNPDDLESPVEDV
jgi:hypothetical protein